MNKHPLQDQILLCHIQWKSLRLSVLLDVVAECFRRIERVHWIVLLLGLHKVHEVNIDALQILCRLANARGG